MARAGVTLPWLALRQPEGLCLLGKNLRLHWVYDISPFLSAQWAQGSALSTSRCWEWH